MTELARAIFQVHFEKTVIVVFIAFIYYKLTREKLNYLNVPKILIGKS